jgi:hypothetical protein
MACQPGVLLQDRERATPVLLFCFRHPAASIWCLVVEFVQGDGQLHVRQRAVRLLLRRMTQLLQSAAVGGCVCSPRLAREQQQQQ